MWDLINGSWPKMTLGQRHLWEIIRVAPEKWSYAPKPALEAEAWVIAIFGNHVIWFNDYFHEMDDGFCISEYERYGRLAPRGDVGAELEGVVAHLLIRISDPSFG
jgi:hypothetical protein